MQLHKGLGGNKSADAVVSLSACLLGSEPKFDASSLHGVMVQKFPLPHTQTHADARFSHPADRFIIRTEQVRREGEPFPCGFTSLTSTDPWPGLESRPAPETFPQFGSDPAEKKKKTSAFNVATFHLR